MALYVKSPDVDALAERLAALKQVKKTEAVRLALQHELEREQAEPALVEVGLAFCRELLARSRSGKGKPADKAFIDSLYDTP